MKCRHCYADCSHQPKSNELSIANWIGLVEALSEQGVVQIYIEGGEPLAKPGLLDLLRSASPRMMTMLRTHGCGLDHSMAAALQEAGLGRALVDVMGATAASHDAQTETPGSFAQSCAAVRHLVACGIPVDVLVILTRHTAPELQAILDLAAGLGAARVGVLRLYPLGRARRIWSELALPLAEQMAALAGLRVPQGLVLMQSWHPKDRNCCWQGAAINAAGRAIGCMYLREYVDFGDATQTPYDEIWRTHPLYRQLRSGTVDASCARSDGGDGSKGGCRSTAFAWTGSWTAPDPFDVELNDGTDLTQVPDLTHTRSRRVCWTREPGLRLRPVAEQGCCLVYRPPAPGVGTEGPRRAPALHALNLTTWLVLSLCDGRDEAAITEEFIAALRETDGHGASRAGLQSALGQLRALGLVQKTKGNTA